MNRRWFMQRLGAWVGGTVGLALFGTPFRLFADFLEHPLPKPVERLYLSLGTTVRFLVFHQDEEAARQSIREAATVVQKIHNLMSFQDPESDLSQWNRSRAGLRRPLDPLMAAAVDEALQFQRSTQGLVDPTVGSAVKAVMLGREPLPQPDRRLDWDAGNRLLRKVHPSILLDLGGTAKGWAVDRAVEVLRRWGVAAAMVNAGGDLRVVGAPPGRPAWRIGLRHPGRPDEVFRTLELRDMAVATSGDYEEAGSILIDPRTLQPVQLGGSVSVVAPTCGEADCLATALSVQPDLSLLPAEAAGVVARLTPDGLHEEATSNLSSSGRTSRTQGPQG